MEKRQLNEKKGILIPNKNGCTNFGAICLDGKKLFALKTAQSNKVSTLYLYQDYRTGCSLTTRQYKGQMGHGNGMTLAGGKLYIAPMDKYVQVLDTQHGMTRKKITAPIIITSIAHVRGDIFLAGLSLIRITAKEVQLVKHYKLAWNDEDFPIAQDIAYRKGFAYIVRSSPRKTANAVLRCPLDEKTIALAPDRIYLSRESRGLYEFESLDFDGNAMIIAANVEGGKDALYLAKV